jgi:hypothetical protein
MNAKLLNKAVAIFLYSVNSGFYILFFYNFTMDFLIDKVYNID